MKKRLYMTHMKNFIFRVAGSNTVGRDNNGDGVPDEPLIYAFKDSETTVEFPLNFCPGNILT